MVYQSLGMVHDQREIWQRVSMPDGSGGRKAATHRLAADARACGFDALIVQAEEPWTTLERCLDRGIRVILNHRLAANCGWGHYSVLIAQDGDRIVLHDPQFGPWRCLWRHELLQLWRAAGARSEIAGQVLVAVAAPGAGQVDCEECRIPISTTHRCSGCRRPISLAPAEALGCLQPDCAAATWRLLFCPHCDRAVSRRSFGLESGMRGDHSSVGSPMARK